MSRFSMSPRYYASVMDEENKETEELLKIELPFTIKTQEDEKEIL